MTLHDAWLLWIEAPLSVTTIGLFVAYVRVSAANGDEEES